jgi:hypothetical protein
MTDRELQLACAEAGDVRFIGWVPRRDEKHGC